MNIKQVEKAQQLVSKIQHLELEIDQLSWNYLPHHFHIVDKDAAKAVRDTLRRIYNRQLAAAKKELGVM